MTYKTSVDGTAITAYVNNPQGDIAKDLRRRARRVLRVARRLAGRDTGALVASIRTSTFKGGPVPSITVYSDLPYALMHHEGTRRHIIRPRTARVLRFKQGGRIVFASSVQHPGTRPNPYLSTALREASK